MKYEGHNKPPERSGRVVLSEQDVADAVRLLFTLLGDRAGAARDGAQKSFLESSKAILAHRKARYRFLSRAMFGEPAWDMLLALYAMDAAGPRQTVGSLTKKSGAPPTSALRWLNYLERHNLVARNPHPNDRRTMYIELTDKGRKAIEDYLSFISEPREPTASGV